MVCGAGRRRTVARNSCTSSTAVAAAAPALCPLSCTCRLMPHFSGAATTSLRGSRALPTTTAAAAGSHTRNTDRQSSTQAVAVTLRSCMAGAASVLGCWRPTCNRPHASPELPVSRVLRFSCSTTSKLSTSLWGSSCSSPLGQHTWPPDAITGCVFCCCSGARGLWLWCRPART